MRILHISDAGLPDPRVERMASTMKKKGHDVVFLGGRDIRGQHLSAFSETRAELLPSGPRIVHDPRVKRRWLRAIREMRPDVVHAHNVVVGHFLLDIDYPVVFDDHEWLSAQKFVFMARPFVRKTAAKLLIRKFPEWERALAERFPVLTVSEGIADYYRQYTSNVGVVINTPMLDEVSWIENEPERKGLVYMGGDFSWPRFIPLRNMSGLREILDFDIVTGLPHREMMKTLTKYRIGITPYRPHPFQRVCNPNKNYEYLHAGLQVLLQENLSHLFEGNRFVHSFRDYNDILNAVDSIPEANPEHIMEMARDRYIWEKRENAIISAYNAV